MFPVQTCLQVQMSAEYSKRPLSEMVAVNETSGELPEQFKLSQNYPNPFNPATSIKFDISSSGIVNIIVYDITGRKVEDLVSGTYDPGSYEVRWDASQYSSGIYFYSLVTSEFTETKKMVLVK